MTTERTVTAVLACCARTIPATPGQLVVCTTCPDMTPDHVRRRQGRR